jgi:type VI secretion system protein ImpA
MRDPEALLQPIRPEQPCGEDLSFAPELDAIGAARHSDDPTLDQGAWQTTRREADWRLVARESAKLLRERSKDLRLAVWLAEAQACQDGLAGLAHGLQVVTGLVERYWDAGLWPQAEDGDHEQRIGNLQWLLARMPDLLKNVALTDAQPGCTAQELDAAQRREGSEGAGALALDAARLASSEQFRATFAEAGGACASALKAMEACLDARLGADSPGFSKAHDALERLLARVPQAAGAERAAGGAAPAPASGAAAMAAAIPAGLLAPGMAPATRAQAVRQLRDIAAYFRSAEPHNPAGYFAEKAADAAEQDLHTWLRRTLRDPGALAHIEEMLGVGAAPA